jgi:hypothetical protein
MAYNSKNLSVLAYANGFTLWHYTSPDSVSDVDTSGYFNLAADMLRSGDMIVANLDTRGTQQGGLFFVKENIAGVVDVSNFALLSMPNTD